MSRKFFPDLDAYRAFVAHLFQTSGCPVQEWEPREETVAKNHIGVRCKVQTVKKIGNRRPLRFNTRLIQFGQFSDKLITNLVMEPAA